MFDPQTLLLFSVACFALTASPGPDMLLIAARSVAQGRSAGIVTYLGVAAGSFCHALALAVGLSQLFLAVPYAYDAVRFAGAAYLLFLAWQAFAQRGGFDGSTAAPRPRSLWVVFRQGMVTNLLNPKVALFFLALFPQFVDPAQGAVGMQIMVLAVILNIIGFGVNGTVVLLAGSMRSLTGNMQAFARVSRYFLGSVFALLAAKLVFDTQR